MLIGIRYEDEPPPLAVEPDTELLLLLYENILIAFQSGSDVNIVT
jgi:hypothetical protein